MKIELQIDNGTPFIPEEIRSVGAEYGMSEETEPDDKVRHSKITSKIVVLDYTYNDRKYRNFYKDGVWSNSENGTPRFTALGLLEFST